METQTEEQKSNNGQLIYVPHNDTIRLLEVYVKRSLSLNDGTLSPTSPRRKEKWVARPKKQRRHSSDPSLHYIGIDEDKFRASEDEPPSSETEPLPEEAEKPAKKPKKSKPSFWKNVLSFFSRKSSDETDEEQDSPETTKAEESSETPACLPLNAAALQKAPSRKKSLRRRFSKRRISFSKQSRHVKDLNTSDITRVEAGFNVEPTYAYYEKFSEELEKIVHEVKEKEEVEPLSDEEVINRIIELTKQEGDAMNDKMKDNPTLSCFFQEMTYSSFQKLLDEYLEKEASPIHNPPTVLPTAPELVKLAFTADFTARIAGLSKQNSGHITGLGNLYLQDIFKYKQPSSAHPWDDSGV